MCSLSSFLNTVATVAFQNPWHQVSLATNPFCQAGTVWGIIGVGRLVVVSCRLTEANRLDGNESPGGKGRYASIPSSCFPLIFFLLPPPLTSPFAPATVCVGGVQIFLLFPHHHPQGTRSGTESRVPFNPPEVRAGPAPPPPDFADLPLRQGSMPPLFQKTDSSAA